MNHRPQPRRQSTQPRHNRKPGKIALLPLMAASALAGSAATTVVLTSGFARPSINHDTFRELDRFGEIFERVHENYVVQPENKVMIEGAIDGMLSSLDPHSSYLSADDFETMNEQTRGSFAGLGIQVTMETEGSGKGLVKVVSPIDDTPAARAGMQSNDLIFEINGQAVFGMTLNDAIALMKGPRGTSVDLKLIRENISEPIELTLVRDIVTVNPVISRVERNNFGYVRLTQFTQQTHAKMMEAIEELDAEIPGGMRGMILDMRNNPGGLLDQSVAVSDAFLEGGEIVSTRGRRPKDTLREMGTPGDVLKGRPIIVLINAGSASASEIVAGALQDRNRALVIGTTSFGKGSVQTVLPLQNGVNGALRLTTARYYTPAGRAIQAVGITPDILMPITRPGDEAPVERRHESDLEGSLAAEVKGLTAEEEQEDEGKYSLLVESIECPLEEDCQLNKALDILEDNTQFTQFLVSAAELERQ